MKPSFEIFKLLTYGNEINCIYSITIQDCDGTIENNEHHISIETYWRKNISYFILIRQKYEWIVFPYTKLYCLILVYNCQNMFGLLQFIRSSRHSSSLFHWEMMYRNKLYLQISLKKWLSTSVNGKKYCIVVEI